MSAQARMRPAIDYARDHGWDIGRSKCGHLRFRKAGRIVFGPSTPTSPRSSANVLAKLRRADRAIVAEETSC